MTRQDMWIELQRVVLSTLMERVIRPNQPLQSEQDADFLADHISDDVFARFELSLRTDELCC